ncbi:MAG: hypothetical protein U0931_04530 [Vulcanimicrobiota bacterium]
MKRLLLVLLLCASALAVPAPYGASFDRSYQKESDKEATIYSWRAGEPAQMQMVVTFSRHMRLPQLKRWLMESLPSSIGHIQETPTRLYNSPAIEVEGLNFQGVPYTIAFFNHKGRSLICGSCTYDLARNRQFVRSLKL